MENDLLTFIQNTARKLAKDCAYKSRGHIEFDDAYGESVLAGLKASKINPGKGYIYKAIEYRLSDLQNETFDRGTPKFVDEELRDEMVEFAHNPEDDLVENEAKEAFYEKIRLVCIDNDVEFDDTDIPNTLALLSKYYTPAQLADIMGGNVTTRLVSDIIKNNKRQDQTTISGVREAINQGIVKAKEVMKYLDKHGIHYHAPSVPTLISMEVRTKKNKKISGQSRARKLLEENPRIQLPDFVDKLKPYLAVSSIRTYYKQYKKEMEK